MRKGFLVGLCLLLLIVVISSCKQQTVIVKHGRRVTCPDCGKVIEDTVKEISVPKSKAGDYRVVESKERCPDCQVKFEKAEKERIAKEKDRAEAERVRNAVRVDFACGGQWLKRPRPHKPYPGASYYDYVNIPVGVRIRNGSSEPITGLRAWLELDKGLAPYPEVKERERECREAMTAGSPVPAIVPGGEESLGWYVVPPTTAPVGSTQKIFVLVGRTKETAARYGPLNVYVEK